MGYVLEESRWVVSKSSRWLWIWIEVFERGGGVTVVLVHSIQGTMSRPIS